MEFPRKFMKGISSFINQRSGDPKASTVRIKDANLRKTREPETDRLHRFRADRIRRVPIEFHGQGPFFDDAEPLQSVRLGVSRKITRFAANVPSLTTRLRRCRPTRQMLEREFLLALLALAI